MRWSRRTSGPRDYVCARLHRADGRLGLRPEDSVDCEAVPAGTHKVLKRLHGMLARTALNNWPRQDCGAHTASIPDGSVR
jgi:hypothetical protein